MRGIAQDLFQPAWSEVRGGGHTEGGIRISMDGRGRAMDHVCMERLWRRVKDEEVYLQDYQTMRDAHQRLGQYFGFYNEERLRQALGYRTPAAVYHG